MTIDIQLRVFMLKNGLTVRSVANRLSISRSFLHDVLCGRFRAESLRQRLVDIGFPPDLVLAKGAE